MTNKKKAKQRQPKGEPSAPRATSQEESGSSVPHAPEPAGTYARYKHNTKVVQDWCDRLAGASATLKDWATAMEALAARGAQMPDAVMHALDQAIALRDEANAFYKDMQAALERQHRHWFVCKLLRHFRRLFRRRAPEQAEAAGEPAALESRGSLGFEALEIEETAVDAEDTDDALDMTRLDAPAEEAPEDERIFAISCLMADAARTREEVRAAWAQWTPVAREHCASLLGATCQANLALTKLERIVNATQMTLGLADTSLATIMSFAPTPRVQLRKLQAKPQLNGRCGSLGAKDSGTGRYAVVLDGGTETVRVKPANISPEFGWATGAGAMIGIMQEVGRAIEAFGATPCTQATVGYSEDHSEQLECVATKGTLQSWLMYGEGNGILVHYSARDTPWRLALRSFQKDTSRPDFTFAFMLLCAVDCNVEFHRRFVLQSQDWRSIPSLVQEELRFYASQMTTGLKEVAKVASFREAAAKTFMQSMRGQVEAVETLLDELVRTTIDTCPWLAGDVLYLGAHQALTLTNNVIWARASDVRMSVHVYHMMRCRGIVRAIPEVYAFLRVFRRSVFYRLELPVKGEFVKALRLACGASVATNQADRVKQALMDKTGQNLSEMSLLHHLNEYNGAGLDLDRLDFQAIAREEVDVLHRAPHLAGMARVLAMQDRLRASGCFMELIKLADSDASGWRAIAERAVACCEHIFPGCGCSPPAPEAAVPLIFSSYTHTIPVQSSTPYHSTQSGSYAPADERITREELRARVKAGIARNKAAQGR